MSDNRAYDEGNGGNRCEPKKWGGGFSKFDGYVPDRVEIPATDKGEEYAHRPGGFFVKSHEFSPDWGKGLGGLAQIPPERWQADEFSDNEDADNGMGERHRVCQTVKSFHEDDREATRINKQHVAHGLELNAGFPLVHGRHFCLVGDAGDDRNYDDHHDHERDRNAHPPEQLHAGFRCAPPEAPIGAYMQSTCEYREQ